MSIHVTDSWVRRAVRMGQHAWLLLATVVTELLVIRKWGKHIYTKPFPEHVKWGWGIGLTLLILYPTIRVSPNYYSPRNF